MPIRFACDACGARIRVPDGSEGRKVRCPKCSSPQHVPAQASAKPAAPAPVDEVPVARPAAPKAPVASGDIPVARPAAPPAPPSADAAEESALAALAALAADTEPALAPQPPAQPVQTQAAPPPAEPAPPHADEQVDEESTETEPAARPDSPRSLSDTGTHPAVHREDDPLSALAAQAQSGPLEQADAPAPLNIHDTDSDEVASSGFDSSSDELFDSTQDDAELQPDLTEQAHAVAAKPQDVDESPRPESPDSPESPEPPSAPAVTLAVQKPKAPRGLSLSTPGSPGSHRTPSGPRGAAPTHAAPPRAPHPVDEGPIAPPQLVGMRQEVFQMAPVTPEGPPSRLLALQIGAWLLRVLGALLAFCAFSLFHEAGQGEQPLSRDMQIILLVFGVSFAAVTWGVGEALAGLRRVLRGGR